MRRRMQHVVPVLFLALACGAGVGGDERDTDVAKGGGVAELKAETLDELLLFEQRGVAVVRCEGAELTKEGSRSERVILKTRVLAVGDGDLPGELQLTRYTQSDSLMKTGQTYLVGIYSDGEWAPAWSLAEWVQVPEDRASEVAESAGRALRARAAGRP